MHLNPLEERRSLESLVESMVFFSGPNRNSNLPTLTDTQEFLSYAENSVSRFDYIPRLTATLFKKLISTEVFLAGINNAKIGTHRYIVADESARIIGDTLPRNARKEMMRGELRPDSLFRTLLDEFGSALSGPCSIRIGGVSGLLTQANDNYGHWHMDVLPSLSLLQELRIDTHMTLLTAELKSYRRRSFELLGVNFDRVRVIGSEMLVNQHVSCERLIFPAPMMVNYGHIPFWQPHVYDRILKALWQQHGNSPQRFSKRLYVDRSNDNKRQCLNEPELARRLEGIGFQVVRPANLTYDEQVLLFANADVIVGCMGAGLVNVVFARRGATVIELKPPRHRVTALWKTYATLAGANHYAIDFDDGAAREGDRWSIPDIDATISEIQRLM